MRFRVGKIIVKKNIFYIVGSVMKILTQNQLADFLSTGLLLKTIYMRKNNLESIS